MSGTEVVTFGCRLNLAESEEIRAQAEADGVSNAVVFNTCAVTAEAVRQARQSIRRMRRERPDARLIVTGCAAQIDPGQFSAMPEVDLVLGNADKARSGALHAHGERVRVPDIMIERGATASATRDPAERARTFVAVQNGCDHRCTFCVIPFGRGNSRSVPAVDVVEQVRRLARHLASRVGTEADVLVEKPGMGRAGDFTEVAVPMDLEPGQVVRLTLAGSDGKRALAA